MKLGPYTLLGQGPEDRGPDDQRQGRDGGREARLPQCVEETTLPRPRRRLLRVAEDSRGQAALSDNHEVRRALRHGRALETWRDPQGNVVPSCTIITTAANDYLAPIHNRMPVILHREVEALWLDPDNEDAASLTPILVPSPDDTLDAYEVFTMVNNARNDGPEDIARVG